MVKGRRIVADAARRSFDRRFSLAGSTALHKALGWDLLKAPANIALAAPQQATRLTAAGVTGNVARDPYPRAGWNHLPKQPVLKYGIVDRALPRALRRSPMEEVMAHREQHGNREAKKPKKEKPKGNMTAQSKWAVSEIIEARTDSKH